MAKKSKVRSSGTIDIEVGNRLRALRMDRSMSQDELAGNLGISFQQVQKYEKGVNRLSVGRLTQLCELLKCDPHELIGWLHKPVGPTIDTETFKLAQSFLGLPDHLKQPIRALITKLIE